MKTREPARNTSLRPLNQQGAVIFLVMAILALIGILVLTIYQYGYQMLFLLSAEKHSSLAREAVINKAIVSGTTNGKDFVCKNQSIKKGRQILIRAICQENYPDIPTRLLNRPIIIKQSNNSKNNFFPTINYNQIFLLASPCKKVSLISKPRSLAGKELSSNSSYSSKTCTTVPKEVTSTVKIVGNLEIERLQVGSELISGQDRPGNDVLATIGYLIIIEQLVITHNTLIVAAGDIFIKELISVDNEDLQVTLVSASGRIEISKLGPTIHARAFAKQGVNAPNFARAKTSQILPPFLQKETIGIYHADALKQN